MEINEKLKEFSVRSGFSPNHFTCTNCTGNGEDPRKYKGVEPFIGKDFGKKRLKLVVLSSDIGNPGKYPEAWTTEGRAIAIENAISNSKHKYNQHLKETIKICKIFLRKTIDFDATVLNEIVLLNSAKCSIGQKQAPDKFFRNCRNFGIEELKILKPDVVIAQGQHAHQILNMFRISNKAFQKADFSLLDNCNLDWTEIVKPKCIDNENSFTCIYTPHPCARNGSYQQFTRDFEQLFPFVTSFIKIGESE